MIICFFFKNLYSLHAKLKSHYKASLLNHIPSVPTCQRGLRANVFACQLGLHGTCLRAKVPKACQLVILLCQRANKCANVLYGVPMFQIGMPTCQKACQFFKHSSYEMLLEISILYYQKKILHHT